MNALWKTAFGLCCVSLALSLVACSSVDVKKENSMPLNNAGKSPIVLEYSAVSGLVLPAGPDVKKPEGAEAGITVLSWAGFKGASSFTFDDGQPSQIKHWPALKATGIPMTFFVCPSNNWVRNFDAVLKDIAVSGSELGNHTYKHKNFADYASPEAIKADIESCTDYIKTHSGQEAVYSFAYPFGDLNWAEYFGDSEFLAARTVFGGSVEAHEDLDPLHLPSFAVESRHSKKDFIAQMDKSAEEDSWVIFLFHSLLPGDNWYAGVPLDDLLASIEFEKQKSEVWMDTMARIAAYWQAQILFENLEPQGNADHLTWNWQLPDNFPPRTYLRLSLGGGKLYQDGQELPWNPKGFYEISMDAKNLEWRI